MKRRLIKKAHSRFATIGLLSVLASESWLPRLSALNIGDELVVECGGVKDLPSKVRGTFYTYRLKYIISRVPISSIDEVFVPGAWCFKIRAFDFPGVYESALEYPQRS